MKRFRTAGKADWHKIYMWWSKLKEKDYNCDWRKWSTF